MDEFRKIFDTIPERFDRYRPRYCRELFDFLISYSGIGRGKRVLELGPGTGQATDPILDTGCEYHAVELGEHLYAKMLEKYGARDNFDIVNGDFITYDFGKERYDMIYSAATIQWIPQDIAYKKTFELLKPGGVLAMMLTKGDFKTPNPVLFDKIQAVYGEYFKPETQYTYGKFDYTAGTGYGYLSSERHEFPGRRVFNAETYVAYCGTHCDHLNIPEPYKSRFFDGLKNAVLSEGDRIEFADTHILYLAKKPYK